MRSHTGIERGAPAWLRGEPVKVRLVCMGTEPYVAWLMDGRRVPVPELTSVGALVTECQGVGW